MENVTKPPHLWGPGQCFLLSSGLPGQPELLPSIFVLAQGDRGWMEAPGPGSKLPSPMGSPTWADGVGTGASCWRT